MATGSYSSAPTKLGEDDDNNERPAAIHLDLVGESHHQHRQDDAFSRYSNDIQRMKALFLLSKDDDDDGDDDDDLDALATINQALSSMGLSNLAHLNRDKRRKGNDSRDIQRGNVRKTRLSWELHPDLLLHKFNMELDALHNGTHLIFDDEEEALSSEKQSQSKVQEVPREEKE